MTIYHRRRELGFLDKSHATTDDYQINELARIIISENPEFRQLLILGRLRALGYLVTRDCLHKAIRTHDPLNNALWMSRGLTARRMYSVAGPNSLWHIG